MGNHLGKAAINIRPQDSVAFTVHRGMELCALLNGKFHEEQVVKRIFRTTKTRLKEKLGKLIEGLSHFISNIFKNQC